MPGMFCPTFILVLTTGKVKNVENMPVLENFAQNVFAIDPVCR